MGWHYCTLELTGAVVACTRPAQIKSLNTLAVKHGVAPKPPSLTEALLIVDGFWQKESVFSLGVATDRSTMDEPIVMNALVI